MRIKLSDEEVRFIKATSHIIGLTDGEWGYVLPYNIYNIVYKETDDENVFEIIEDEDAKTFLTVLQNMKINETNKDRDAKQPGQRTSL